MTTVNVAQGNDGSLPQALMTAQAAIHLPEVQEMLRRLAEYKLGIFMPHMHNEHSGEFQLLPDNVIQVESGLEVSFQPLDELANRTDRFLPVGWGWRAGASIPLAVCEMVREGTADDTERYAKHKTHKSN
jgi:hypothetical protein